MIAAPGRAPQAVPPEAVAARSRPQAARRAMRLLRVAKKFHRAFAFYLQHCRIEEAVANRVRLLRTLRGACAQWRIVLVDGAERA